MPKKSQTAKVIQAMRDEIAEHMRHIEVLEHAIAKLEEAAKKARA